ncbi:MAG: HAD family hydrolase [Bacillota bacterium]
MLIKAGKRPGVIIDFDDTLVETAIHFETSRERFKNLMKELGFPEAEVLRILDMKDIENVKSRGGFMKECFPNAMAQTYNHLCRSKNLRPDPGVCRAAEEIGWWVFDQDPGPVSSAVEVLQSLSVDYSLFLATKGDRTIQWRRIQKSGMRQYFKKIYVLNDKTKSEYEHIAMENSIDPGSSWVIGNSMKSDINPGILAGFNCIYIPNRYTWGYEMEDPVGEYVELESLAMVPGILSSKKCRTDDSFSGQ